MLGYAAFSGTGEGYSVLKGLSERGLEPEIVYTYPKRMRRTISNIHSHEGFNTVTVTKGFDVAADIRGRQVDAVLVIAWSRLLSEDVLASAPWVIGRHLAAVPMRRGRAPVAWAIIDGLECTEVNIMQLTAEMDAGPVVASRKVDIQSCETSRSLLDKLNRASVDLFEKCLRTVDEGRDLPLHIQKEDYAGYTIKRTDVMGHINWCLPAEHVDRLIRACGPPYWGAYTLNGKGKKIRILTSVVDMDLSQSGPGVVWKKNGAGVHISCGVGGVIVTPVAGLRVGDHLR